MLALEQAARRVVETWETSDLSSAVNQLDQVLKHLRQDRQDHEATIETAQKLYANDDLEIDDEPLVSIQEEGIWVNAWVWVPTEPEAS